MIKWLSLIPSIKILAMAKSIAKKRELSLIFLSEKNFHKFLNDFFSKLLVTIKFQLLMSSVKVLAMVSSIARIIANIFIKKKIFFHNFLIIFF